MSSAKWGLFRLGLNELTMSWSYLIYVSESGPGDALYVDISSSAYFWYVVFYWVDHPIHA